MHTVTREDESIRFDFLPFPDYQDQEGRTICSPGSVFEGIIRLTLPNPVPAYRVKLVFKASERVNYHVMGWESPKDDCPRLFSVRTILWGFPSDIQQEQDEICPVLEAGQHEFPFICQMPVVNFPPTFENYLISTTYHLFVAIDHDKTQKPIISQLFPIVFKPMIETRLLEEKVSKTTRLTPSITVYTSVPQLEYDMSEPVIVVPITVQFNSSDFMHITSITAHVKRIYQINYKSFSRSESAIIASYNHTKIDSSNTLPLTVTGLDHPTLVYSNRLKIEYRLVVTVKVRHGPLIYFKRKILDQPLVIGTLPVGTKAPRQLEPYSLLVDNNSNVFSKPSFIKTENTCEYLPAYDDEPLPPNYPYTPSIQI